MKQFKHKTLLARASMMLLAMLCFLGGARAQQALPYEYGFENNNLTAEGWTAQISSSNSGINDAAAHEGSFGFRFNYSENPGYLVSPLLDGGTNPIDVSFFYKEYSSSYGNENFQVGYTTDANETDPSNFTYGTIIEASTSWQQYTETLPAGTVRMAIKYLYVDAFYLYLDDFTFEASNPCAKPANLNVTTDGQTATVTWDGTATNNFIVTVNGGTPATNQTSPYTFNVALSTTYEVVVVADCGAGSTSNPESISFTTPDCIGGHVIEYTLNDSFGDGWNGNAINVVEGCGNVIATLTIENGNLNSGTLTLCSDYYEFVWVKGSYPAETSWTFTEGGTTLFSGAGTTSMATGDVLYTIGTTTPKPTNLAAGTPDTHEVALTWTPGDSETAWQICLNNDESNIINIDNANSTINEGTVSYTLTDLTADTEYSVMVRAYIDETTQSCWSAPVTFTTAEACPKPTNLAETNITTNSATLSWEGYNDSYLLQYRPWFQVGEDTQATGEFVTYTYDLSEFSGMGSIAIRHYDVTDMFYLNIDDVLLTDANGNTLFSEDFESGTIPSTWTNYDVDGDGYVWDLANSSNMSVNGNYGVYSASWLSGVGALTPDNWLIISNVEMGGTFSFAAIGQDPSYPAENFAVYVSLESDITEVPVAGTTYNAENLEPGTPYAWQVKGVCGEETTKWVSALFKTKDDLLVFANDGNWNEVANWTDGEGNAATALPTTDNKVRIDADAIVPAGYIAEAGKATINGGSITIKDGGQLKHKAATLKVTMEKDITGYGTGTGNYKFISSPFTGITLIGDEGNGWSYVETGDNYDLYGFASTEGNEWINNESSPNHAVYTSGNNHGLRYGDGYLYANEEDITLNFTGTTTLSVNSTNTSEVSYDATSEDPFNGWMLIGNPFTCNGYITYSGDATFFKMNAAGDGFEAYEDGVELAPGEGTFIKVSASGTITFSSEVPASTPDGSIATGLLPILMSHGEETDQDADLSAAITFAKEGYATYYNGVSDVVLPAGMKAHVVTDGSTNLTYAEVADGDTDGGNVVPAGTAVLLQVEPSTEAQTLPVYLATPSVASYTGTNLLFGSDEDATTTTGGEKYYKLTYSNNNDKFGWYWGAANGAAFTSPAHKAWLALPASSAPFLGLPGWEETTGIVPVGFDSENGEWYTLQGIKVGKKPSTAGVYIHNGRKVVIK